jgi:ABC-type phosphate transport system substrate-binding protein
VRRFAYRALLPLLLGLGLVASATGCGIELDSAPDSAGASGAKAVYREPVSGVKQQAFRPTPRSVGVIRIAGQAQGSLTEDLINAYGRQGTGVEFNVSTGNEQAAFDEFCSGDADIVDSARPISPAEFQACQARGIQPVQFQVASDAAVLAIRNETDVGVDCLSFGEVRNIFRAGSPINSWSQVGYGHEITGDVAAPRMKVAGPDQDSNVFGFFGQYVLGDPEPTLSDFRSDYQAYPSDSGVRRAVVGSSRDYYNATQLDRSEQIYEDIISSIADARQAVADAKAEVAKGIRDGRTKAAKQRDQRKLAAAEQNLTDLQNDVPGSIRFRNENRASVRNIEQLRGTMGLFRFSYYEAFEEELRPMEVSASDDFAEPECIFPSQSTITNATYPLSRQLLLTVNYRNIKDSDINDFLTTAVGEAQKLAEEAALVPLPDEVRDTEQTWLDGSSEPDIIFYSTPSSNGKASKGQGSSGNASGQ